MLHTNTANSKTGHFQGHEAFLNHFLRSGKKVSLILDSNEPVEGIVKAFDKYTISLGVSGKDGSTLANTEEENTIVFFKSALIGFYSTEK